MKYKICKKCGKNFPKNRIEINGKIHVINSRKYCFECSPFGCHNTRQLGGRNNLCIINNIQHRTCSLCNNTLPETFDNFTSRIRGGFCSYCRKCMCDLVIKRQNKLKLMALEYKGGKCIICGYNKCFKSLDFHHVNPTEKKYSISRFKKHKFDVLKEELDKCVILCRNCHGEEQNGLIPKNQILEKLESVVELEST